MKLVDILARELKVWPEGVVTAVQDLDGEVKFDNSHEMPRMNNSKDVWIRQGDQSDCLYPRDLAEDCSYAIVTRAQWQAAVDALKAAENAVPEWNGEGLPPVGTVCELQQDDEWCRVEVMYLSKNTILLKFDIPESEDSEGAYSPDDQDLNLRPLVIRTPEQIAADERNNAIDSMIGVVNAGFFDNTRAIYGALYDAGYRKFEIVDN